MKYAFPVLTIVAWDQAPQWCKKAKNGVKQEKYRRAKRAQRWSGEGERAAEPGDMLLMPLFHDTRFWYHALIGQIISRSFSFTPLLSGKRFFKTRISIGAAIQISLRDFSLILRLQGEQKMCL